MPNVNFEIAVLYFFAYSIIGWCCEEVYCFLGKRKWVKRGFLHGPYCPVYGFGAITVLFVLTPLKDWPPLLFAASVLITSIIEYFTSWLMEALFRTRWWDYSKRKFNINGRVCLLNSILFGFMGMGMAYLIHPPMHNFVNSINSSYIRVISSLIISVMLIDFFATLHTLSAFRESLAKLRVEIEELKKYHPDLYWLDRKNMPTPLAEKVKNHIKTSPDIRRLLKAFPHLTSKNFNEAANTLKESTRLKRERRNITLSGIFLQKEDEKAKARTIEKINFYDIFWLFVTSSVIGYILETLFCLVTKGHFESRQGLLYGPFSQVYGFGAVFMVLLLRPLTKLKDMWIFTGSAVIGGVFEFICSFFQEKVFGTVSWEYSSERFNIGGRTSLTYMFFWGVLGLFLIKEIFPRLAPKFKKIYSGLNLALTIIFAVIIAVDMLISAMAVNRWVERDGGAPPETSVEVFLDKKYPDEKMQEIYPNMQVIKSE